MVISELSPPEEGEEKEEAEKPQAAENVLPPHYVPFEHEGETYLIHLRSFKVYQDWVQIDTKKASEIRAAFLQECETKQTS